MCDGRRISGALFVIILAPLLARAADQVTPSDRVETHVRIRADPNSSSEIVGFLNPGQQRPLHSSVPNWYEIELPGGASGFVSKAWTTRIPETPVVSTAIELRLGAWNIRKLGHGTEKNFTLLAQAINSHFDILAVIEVMQKSGGHPGYEDLMSALGPTWTGMITDNPRPNTTSGSAEFYAIIFRTDRVRACDGWDGLRIHADHDGGASGTGGDLFSREPAFGCFVALRSDNSPGFDFLLAAYHARWADGDILDIHSEVVHLPAVFASMSQALPGERDLLVAGDFNLRPTDLAMVVTEADATVGSGSTLNSAGDITTNLYDHVLLLEPSATTELIQPATILDLRPLAQTRQAFFRTVSDHLPLIARFRVVADDD